MTFGDIIVLFFFCLLCGVVVWEVLKFLWWVGAATILLIYAIFLLIFKNKQS